MFHAEEVSLAQHWRQRKAAFGRSVGVGRERESVRTSFIFFLFFWRMGGVEKKKKLKQLRVEYLPKGALNALKTGQPPWKRCWMQRATCIAFQ